MMDIPFAHFEQAVAQIIPEKMPSVSCDSYKPSGDSFFDSPDGFSEPDCEAVWATACEFLTQEDNWGIL
jgi:hypothetical protein